MTGVFPPQQKEPTNEEKIMWVIKGTILAIGAALCLVFFGAPVHASAQMFPSDAITLYEVVENSNTSGNLFATSTEARTILSATQSCEYNGRAGFSIGQFAIQPNQNNLIDTSANGQYFQSVNQIRNWNSGVPITYWKTALHDYCSYWLTYVPRNLSATTATSTGMIGTVGGFSYGEIIIILLLLLTFTLLLFSDVRNMIFKNGVVVRVIKEYDRKTS